MRRLKKNHLRGGPWKIVDLEMYWYEPGWGRPGPSGVVPMGGQGGKLIGDVKNDARAQERRFLINLVGGAKGGVNELGVER